MSPRARVFPHTGAETPACSTGTGDAFSVNVSVAVSLLVFQETLRSRNGGGTVRDASGSVIPRTLGKFGRLWG